MAILKLSKLENHDSRAEAIMTRLIFVIPLVVTTYLWNMIPRWKFQPRGDEKNGLELRAAQPMEFRTLSLRNPDGSFEDIGRVEGSDEYISMMKRLSAPSAKHIR
ncbi:hypothetical protein M7I_3926 [Glarea lozoyensis 74030]|uniref:Uncharacterized protein n=1 Tax=Glarea lozoyensis (strain ATCC 74030 / MF5533) TaxID=1104152 RepID=H0EMS9_GLAL7|nr:hypothetical protein M7I_3926 [Glarea lozoyensis 74030]